MYVSVCVWFVFFLSGVFCPLLLFLFVFFVAEKTTTTHDFSLFFCLLCSGPLNLSDPSSIYGSAPEAYDFSPESASLNFEENRNQTHTETIPANNNISDGKTTTTTTTSPAQPHSRTSADGGHPHSPTSALSPQQLQQLYSHYGSNLHKNISDSRKPHASPPPHSQSLLHTASPPSPRPSSSSSSTHPDQSLRLPAHPPPHLPPPTTVPSTSTALSLGTAHNLPNMPVYQHTKSEFDSPRQQSETHTTTYHTSIHNSEGLDNRTMATSFYQHQFKQNKGDLYERGISRSPRTTTPSPTYFPPSRSENQTPPPPPAQINAAEEDLMTCVFCSKSFYSHSELERHIECSHSGNQNPFGNHADNEGRNEHELSGEKRKGSTTPPPPSSLDVLQDWESQQERAFYAHDREAFSKTAPALPPRSMTPEMALFNRGQIPPGWDWDGGIARSPQSPQEKANSHGGGAGAANAKKQKNSGNRIFHMEAYCSICNREFCNKYFLKTHKANKHNIFEDTPQGRSGTNTSPTTASLQSLMYPPQQPPRPPPSSGPLDMTNVQSVGNTSPITSPKAFATPPSQKSPKANQNSRSEAMRSPSSGAAPHFHSLQHLVSSSINQPLTSPSTATSAPKPSTSKELSSFPALPPSLPELKTSTPSSAIATTTPGTLPEDYCEVCQKTFCNKYYLKKHKYDVHGLGKPKEPKERNPKGSNAKNLSNKVGLELSSLERWNASLSQFPPGIPPPYNPYAAGLLGPDALGHASVAAQAAAAAMAAAAVSPNHPLMQFQNALPFLNLLPKPPLSAMLDTPNPEVFPQQSSPPAETSNTDMGKMPAHSQSPGVRAKTPMSPKVPATSERQAIPSSISPKAGSPPNSSIYSAPSSWPLHHASSSASMTTTAPSNPTPSKSPKLTNEEIKSLGIVQPDAYCEMCRKEFCNKYFLRVHKANKHGIFTEETPRRVLQPKSKNQNNQIQQLALPASAPPHLLQNLPSGAQDPEEPTNLSMRANATPEPGEREYKNDEEPGERIRGKETEDAFCYLCNKEFADKQWLHFHNINVHRLIPGEGPEPDQEKKDAHVPAAPETPQDMTALSLQALISASNMASNLPSGASLKQGEPVSCEFCKKEMANEFYLDLHKMKVHGVFPQNAPPNKERTVLAPPVSPMASKEEKSVKNEPDYHAQGHLMDSHARERDSKMDRSPEQASGKPYQPSESLFPSAQSFDQAQTQRMALLMNGINPDTYCDHCNKEFSSIYLLKTHKQSAHGIPFDEKEFLHPPPKESAAENLSMALVPTSASASQRAMSLPPSSGLPLLPSLPPLSQGSPGANSKLGPGNTPLNSVRVFCNLCNKELCNKYFLKTHMLNKHGIVTEDPNMAVLAAKMPGLVPPTQAPKAAQGKDKEKPKNMDWLALSAMPGVPPFPGPPTSQGVSNSEDLLGSRDAGMEEGSTAEGGLENDLNNTRYFNYFREACQLCDRRFKSAKWLQNHLIKDHGLPPEHFLLNAALAAGVMKSAQVPGLPPGFPLPSSLSQLGVPLPSSLSQMLQPGFSNPPTSDAPNIALNLVKTSQKSDAASRRSASPTRHSRSPSPVRHNSADARKFSCEACGESFIDSMRLQIHLIQDHCADVPLNMKATLPDQPSREPEQPSLPSKKPPPKKKLGQSAISHLANRQVAKSKKFLLKCKEGGAAAPAVNKKPFNCPNCKGKFLSHPSLVYHLQRIHNVKATPAVIREITGKRGPKFRCGKCQQRFFTRKTRKIHLKSLHQEITPAPKTRKRSLKFSGGGVQKRQRKDSSSPLSHPNTSSNGDVDPPTAFGTPAKLSNQGSFIMQRFVLKESDRSSADPLSNANFVTAVVYLPVKQKVTESVVTTFELSPSE